MSAELRITDRFLSSKFLLCPIIHSVTAKYWPSELRSRTWTQEYRLRRSANSRVVEHLLSALSLKILAML